MKIKACFGETVSCGPDDFGNFYIRVDRDDSAPMGVLDKRGARALRDALTAFLRPAPSSPHGTETSDG